MSNDNDETDEPVARRLRRVEHRAGHHRDVTVEGCPACEDDDGPG